MPEKDSIMVLKTTSLLGVPMRVGSCETFLLAIAGALSLNIMCARHINGMWSKLGSWGLITGTVAIDLGDI